MEWHSVVPVVLSLMALFMSYKIVRLGTRIKKLNAEVEAIIAERQKVR